MRIRRHAAEDETLQAKLRLVKRVNEMIRLLENRGVKEEKEKAEVLDEDLLAYLEEQYRRQDQIRSTIGQLRKKEATLHRALGKIF
ncbi:MAG: hypothetical protein V8S95_00340 [Odoribacter sp.]